MKKNKLLKTGALALGTVASIAAPIAAVVSCGGGYAGRYETENDGVIKVMESFSAGGKQEKPLLALIDYYNKHIKEAGDMKVDHVHMEGGYGSMEPFLRQSFEAGDTKKIPNLMINYPDSIGALVKYKMQLKLDDSIKSKFDPELISEANDNIGGLGDKGLYAVPFAKSTDMQIVNNPVMGYIFGQLGYNQSDIDREYPNNSGDKNAVAAIFGAISADSQTKTSIQKDFPLASVKTNAEKLLTFITKVTPLFTSKQKDAYILGIDAATNFIYQNVYSKVGGDMKNFIFSKGADGYIQYNWKDHTSPSYLAFKEVYGKLQAALNVGGVYIGGNGAYTSAKSVLHQVGISYGSTAGYSHDFLPDSQQHVAKLTEGGAGTKNVATIQLTDQYVNPNVVGLLQFGKYSNTLFGQTEIPSNLGHNLKTKDAAQDTSVKNFLSAHSKNVHFDKTAPTDAGYQVQIDVIDSKGTESKYSLYTDDKTSDIKTPEIIAKENKVKNAHLVAQFGNYANKILDDTTTPTGYDIKTTTKADTDKLSAFIKAHENTPGVMFFSDEKEIDGNFPKTDYVKFSITNKSGDKKDKFLLVSSETADTDASLQKSEIGVLTTPSQFGDSKVKAQLLQGPSVIGIHANKDEDVNTDKFVKWFFGDETLKADSDIKNFEIKAGETLTPAQYFALKADYIVPTNVFLKTDGAGLSDGPKIAFDTIKKGIGASPSVHLFDNPVDDTTGPFRTNMESTLMQQYDTAHADGLVRDAAGIYSDIEKIGQ